MSTLKQQLHERLEQLQAYQLPDKFTQSACGEGAASVSDDILERYQRARNTYLQKRTQQVFYEHLATFSGDGVEFPDLPTEEAKQQLKDRRLMTQQSLKETAVAVNKKFVAMIQSYESLVDKRQDLIQQVQDMTQEATVEDEEDGEDEPLEEEELLAQEQRLANLRLRRAELQAELDQIRTETEQKQQLLSKQPVRVLSPTTVIAIQQNKAKITELQEMQEWYDTMRGVLEELSGMKILAVDTAGEQNLVTMKVLLLDSHQVMITLQSDGRDALLVVSARFITSTKVSVDDTLEWNIPSLEDLVQVSSSLGPVEDLRFVLRETMARIRIHQARVQEFTTLRKLYLTKIGKLPDGGQDQEIVCSLQEGITVVLRLSPDCPLVLGSVTVDQLVGIGGWEYSVMETLQESTNRQMCFGPISIMEVLMGEIKQLQAKGISIPTTPTLPQRHK